jgi:hypothetical protein
MSVIPLPNTAARSHELDRLQLWYATQCNGDWEHTYGVRIGTLDNPGWSLDIDLAETALETAIFAPLDIERSPGDWVHCRIDNSVFMGRGGVGNLNEILNVFMNWAQSVAPSDA